MASYTYPDPLSEAKEGAKDQMRSARDAAEGVTAQAGQRMQEAAGTFRSTLNRSIKDQPIATLAATAAVGFLLGALWKR